MNNLYLIEFYTVNVSTKEKGWAINFAWVYAADATLARSRLATEQGERFDCVVSCSQQAAIVPLSGDFKCNTPDANLFIYQ